MKKIFWIAILAMACSKAPSEKVLSPAEFETNYKATANAILLDVRTEEEVANGKIMQAKSIVYDDAFATKLDSLAQQPLFVYCGSGIRSAKAAAILREKGYEVFELEGGIKNWKAAGKPVN
ncbi:MAG: rhodanese-like domain-containing protein [Bacteroidetes bacterium]|nr:rhodanese-like domain-containing protein [Bacteroidota bacterium]